MESFVSTLGAYVASLYDEVTEQYPALSSDHGLTCSAMALVHAVRVADSASGADDNYTAMLSAAEAVARTATATAHDIGSISTERAAHAWFGTLPMDPTAVVSRVADAWLEASKSVVVTKRTKRGTHREVKKYGRSFVVGGIDTRRTERVTPYPLDEELKQLRRTSFGADGIEVARITTAAFHVDMLGGEFKSWSEILPADVSARLGAEPYSYAAHTTGPYIGTNERQPVSFRTAYRTTMRRRDSDSDDPMLTPGAPTARRTIVAGVVVRDDSGKVVTKRAERVAVRSAPTDRYFIGHAVHHRAPTKRDAATTKRSYSEAFLLPAGIDPLEAIGHAAAVLERDSAATFRSEDGTIVGTLSRGKGGRLAGTLGTISGKSQAKGCRTIDALRKQLAPALL